MLKPVPSEVPSALLGYTPVPQGPTAPSCICPSSLLVFMPLSTALVLASGWAQRWGQADQDLPDEANPFFGVLVSFD